MRAVWVNWQSEGLLSSVSKFLPAILSWGTQEKRKENEGVGWKGWEVRRKLAICDDCLTASERTHFDQRDGSADKNCCTNMSN